LHSIKKKILSNFKELGLSDKILEVLEQIGFETPTPIQEKAIPMLLGNDHTDFIGLAQTGTGKTAAFGLPLLDLIDESNKHTQALIMAPTRELGQQIAAQLVEFAKNNRRLNIEVVYGGASIMGQIRALRNPTQIVVATPGRLLDLIGRRAVQLDHVEYVILDEADEMLNMGFKEDIDSILEHTGTERAIWLFSATMPSSIRRIVKKYMDAPLEVIVNTQEISNKDITHQYVMTKMSNRLMALRRFMDIQPEMRGVLFCRTKRETEEIADQLGSLGYTVAALNGDMSQQQRDKVMYMFKNRSMQLLVATDVAARGIDVKDLTHVIHHSLPDQIEYYTHRSGRTGRAGNKGISLVFITPRESRKIEALERRIKIQFERIEIPSQKEVMAKRVNNWADFIVKTEVHEQAEKILTGLEEKFAELSKEDILKRLISTQVDHLLMQEGQGGDLNATDERRSDRRSEGRPERRFENRPDSRFEGRSEGKKSERSPSGKDGTNRYFINVGIMDGVSRGDLVQFLSDASGIKRKHIGDISLQKNCAFFDVDSTHDKGFAESFRGVEIEGRAVRVNLDMDTNRPKKGKKKFRDSKGDRGAKFRF
jgi:ATP-dependent RNA helicase DeaD